MKHMICIAGFPQPIVAEISKTSAKRFTGDRLNPPIYKSIPEPFFYRPGMSEYYLNQLASRIAEENPTQDIGIGVICADYGASTSAFLAAFFPFAIVATVEPIYLNTLPKRERREAILAYLERLAVTADDVRDRIAVVRDVLSGNNFSPLTLPLRNFQSNQLQPSIRHLFDVLGSGDDVRGELYRMEEALKKRHPKRNLQDAKRTAYFEDDRRLRFKSPGKDKHAMARRLDERHSSSCFIGARARLGGPIDHAFHYDCEYERGGVDRVYPNCHGTDAEPFHRTHANIAPNDYVR
jgi:hypothetical protein